MIIELINEYINRGLRLLLTLFMAVMIIAVVWQVFTRFVLNDPANFTDELSRYLLIWIGVLGGAYTFSIRRHLALELLSSRYGEKGRNVLSILTNLIVVMLSTIAFIYGGYLLVSSTIANGQISPGIVIGGKHLLIGYVYLVVPISGALITYFGVLDIFRAIYFLTQNHSHHRV
ncbi:TRAP transporter small permease [Vibrio fluvialis]|uniref:TRAP transporter small permease n=1 Tax=Vibrio fluvialis TaxID=676 RepID=UPI002572FA86|nr:TRAP transporter small permease [Vibrio fluvialis]BEI25734.1 TRAP transporter small permease [Vibrio fluvialis]